MTSKAMSAAFAIIEQARCNCEATDDHSLENFHYHIEYNIGVYSESYFLVNDEELDSFDEGVRECLAAVLEVIEGPFSYIVGCEYRTQDGQYVKVLGRAGQEHPPGYETLICSDGKHRYDRSTSKYDAGRVTGTAHDYSYGGNFTRELQL